MVELTDLEGALPTDAVVRVDPKWDLSGGGMTKQQQLQALDSKAWQRFQTAATMNQCDGAPRKRTKRVGPVSAWIDNIGDPDSVDYRCAITFYDIGAGFDPEDPTDGRWHRLFPQSHFPATWRRGPGCLFRLTPYNKIFDKDGKVLANAEVVYVLKANLVLQMQAQFAESRGQGFRTKVPDPDRPGVDMFTPWIEFPLGYKNPLTGIPFSPELYAECLTPLIVEAAKAGPDGRSGVMTLAGGFVRTPASGAPPTMRVRQIAMEQAAENLSDEELAERLRQMTERLDNLHENLEQMLADALAREAAAEDVGEATVRARARAAVAEAGAAAGAPVPVPRGPILDHRDYLVAAANFEREGMQQPPAPDPSNPAPTLVPITRANISYAPLRLVDVGSVRVDEFEAMGILSVEEHSPIVRWRNEQDNPRPRPLQEPRYWRDPLEFEHTYSARGLDFRHWYNGSQTANEVMNQLVLQRNRELVAAGLEMRQYRQSPPLLMPWPPERMLNVQALLTRHLARWTLHSDSVGPGFPHGLPASGLSGELRAPDRAAYDAEQSQSIVLGAPQHEDFGAFLRGKILRSRSIAAARAAVFGPANLSPEVRERLEREFEWYMPLTAGTQRAIGDVGLHSIVNELLHADPDGREIPYERGGRWLRPEDRHLYAGLPLDKLSTQGRAQQLLVTVVWEDGEEYEPMMHTGWYRTGPSNAQQDRDGPSWRYSLPCHRVYVRFLPAHAAPMDMAAGRAQTSDLEGPMLVNLPDGFEADVIHRAFASSTSAPREAEAGLRELRASASFKAQLEEGYWQQRGIDMQTGNGLMRHVRRGGRNPDESVVLWGHVRRSRAEPLSMYNTMPTYEDDDGLVAELSANTHCPRCPRRYPSPLSSAARDGLIFDMGDIEVPVSTARLVQPSQLDAFEQRRPVSISLAAREIGALMLGQLLHPGAPPAGEPPSPTQPPVGMGPLLAAIRGCGSTVGEAGRPLHFEPVLVEDPWFLEVHPEVTDSNGEVVRGRRMFKAGMRLVLSTSTVQANAARKLAQLLLDRQLEAEARQARLRAAER